MHNSGRWVRFIRVLAHSEIETEDESDADEFAGMLIDPGAPVQRFLDIVLNIVEALADLLAGRVNRLAQIDGMCVEVSLGRFVMN